MSSYAIRVVDTALDHYIRQMGRRGRGISSPRGVRCATLASGLHGVTSEDMSMYLSEYRVTPNTKYQIGCEGYGTAARWVILSRPGSDPKDVQRARADHTKYVARDALTRLMRDRLLEVDPATMHTVVDDQIEHQFDLMVQALELSIQLFDAQVNQARRLI